MTRAAPAHLADRNFVLQQGLDAPEGEACVVLSSALRFQPRIVGIVVAVGMVSQSSSVFGALAVVLAWSALLPRWNPFDLAYNLTLGRRPGAPRLGTAPAPRRFAQGLGAAFATAIAALLAAGVPVVPWALEGFFLAAIAALALARLCLGSFVFHFVGGRRGFAMRTLPWSGRAGAALEMKRHAEPERRS